jgi:vacuolar-type H+-ATPase subunit E/Vma4
MTVEEIEIIVTAKVTEALTELSKLKPKISQIMNQAQNEISKVDFETISKKASSVQKDIKEVFDVNDTSNISIKVNGKDIDVYEKEVREASAKIKEATSEDAQCEAEGIQMRTISAHLNGLQKT